MNNAGNAPMQALAAPTCPLCNGPNACAPAASGSLDSPCWCTDASISADALARVPDAMIGKACLCRSCATSLPKANPEPS